MGTRNSMRAFGTMAIFSGVLFAQTQPGQQPPPQQQQQTQQQQQQQQAQPVQPAKKVSAWQRLRQAAQAAGVNTGQVGAQQTQQGVQQGVQQGIPGAQQSIDGAQQGIQQMTQGVQQQGVQQGVQQMVPGQGAANVSSGSCGPSCFDAGPFQANVSQMTMSQQGYWHIIRMNVQFRNSSNQPLIIAYREGSMVMIDNNGSSYQGAGGNPGELQGMGIDRGNQTDAQFVLAPGQTGSAMFSVARARGNDSPIGTGFTYNLTIDELQAQNGAMAIPVRQYNLNFPSLMPNTVSATMPSGGGVPANSYVAGGKGAAIGAAPVGNVAARPGVAAAAARPGAMPAAQPRVNGQPAGTMPARGAMVPAALKSPVATAKPAVVVPGKPAMVVPAKPAAVVPARPSPAVRPTAPVKKTPAAATTGTATK